MGKTIREIYSNLPAGAFAIKNENYPENIYAVVYSIREPMGVPVKDGILQGLPRLILNADKPEWTLLNNVDLSRYVYRGLFKLDSIVTMRTKNDRQFGKTIKENLHTDIGFIKWAIREHFNFFLSEEVIDYIRKNNLGVSEIDIADNIQRRKEESELGVTHHPNDFRSRKV